MDVLTERDHLLVAFDGPIAQLPVLSSPASRLRVLIADAPLPRKVRRTDDPFIVLSHAATIGPATARAVYAQLCRIEHSLVSAAGVTPGVHDALAVAVAAGTRVTVVTSLDVSAVRAFLVLHGLEQYVHQVAGRSGPDRAILPPAPDLITLAAGTRPVESCVFIGSTDVDLAAAQAAGVDTVRQHAVVLPPVPETPPNPWLAALDGDGVTKPGAIRS
ncbi:HAD family hydrolase [Kibdelosporangium philippinense]|uniref:HAD family hydrolase n=1 Tax=Kibdelosporangium philippinense TaxID=211113 RepID=A0ABS8ZBW8_9PSEU|nr:HAD family hydrolase [Kibdelosporangium philippinense]MCE7004330.1 HAD family hydrolase [Kibdelosporangium philippinense]